MTISTILDVVVILLLLPTIVYAVVLNRKLSVLRKSREELSKVVNSFNEATMRAEAGIPKLKKAATEANQTLKDRVDKAQTLRDDLAFMIERAEELAARLEGAVRAARIEGAPVAAPNTYAAAAATPPARAMAETPAPARNFTPSQGAPPNTLSATAAATLAHTAAGFEETAAELRNALGLARAEARVPGPLGNNNAQGAGGPLTRTRRTVGERPAERAPEPMAFDDERSEAERELLKALQSAR